MIQAKHHAVIYPIFSLLTQYLMNHKFHSVHVEGDFEDTGKPVLVIANHVSWWDGFWILHLNMRVIHRRFHFMMLEEQLKKHWYFQYIGGYSVKKKTRSIVESIGYTIELLRDNGNMVFMFPQGEITSMHNHAIVFEKGAQRIVDGSSDDVQVLFMANFIDYFSDPKPNVFLYLKKFPVQELKKNQLEFHYNKFYQQALNTQKIKVS